MAPRATVQQAIEFLKIHQLRKETAAIYQQVQSLRDEVADLHDVQKDAHEQFCQAQTNFSEVKDVIVQARDHIGKIDASITSLGKEQNLLQTNITSVQHQHDKELHNIKDQHAQLIRRTILLEDAKHKSEKRHEDLHDTLGEQLHQLRGLSERMRDNSDTTSIRARLGKVERDVEKLQNDPSELVSGKRITGTNGGNDEYVVDDDTSQTQVETEQSSNIENAGSELILTFQPDVRAPPPTTLDDLDLDESADSASHATHKANLRDLNDLSITLPHQADSETSCIGRILALKQNLHEDFISYLKQGSDLIDQLANDPEGIVLRYLIQGLADQRHRNMLKQSLNATSWTRRNLEDIVRLHGSIQVPGSAIQPLEQDISVPQKGHVSPRVLIPATESIHHNTHEYVTPTKLLSPFRPRGSQRLAAKSQTQTLVYETESVVTETESQAEALDARVAQAARARTIRENTTKARPNHAGVQTRNKTKTNHGQSRKSVVPALQKQKAAKPNLRQTDQANAADIQSDALKACESRGAPEPPRTPTREILQNSHLFVEPRTPGNCPSSPLYGKRPKVSKVVFTAERVGVGGTVPYPYNPQPRLVSKVNQPPPFQGELTSDSDVFLPQPKLQSRRRAQTAKELTGEPQQKRRRLPPEIPILSTSTEEDHRFDRWC